jgi:hypothetical protein
MRAISGVINLKIPRGSTYHDYRIRVPSATGSKVRSLRRQGRGNL